MVEKGHVWGDAETKLLLEIWQHIQKQLQGSFKNVNVYTKLIDELRKKGYIRTISQCSLKIKALKKRYRDIVYIYRQNTEEWSSKRFIRRGRPSQ